MTNLTLTDILKEIDEKNVPKSVLEIFSLAKKSDEDLRAMIQEMVAEQVKDVIGPDSVQTIIENLRQAKGDKGDRGNTPTKEEVVALIRPLIPEPVAGKDGRNPIFLGNTSPKNPQKGDLWYQDA